jgi:hypothetical protein
VVKTASVVSVTSASCFVRTAAHGLRKRASLAALSFFEAEKFLLSGQANRSLPRKVGKDPLSGPLVTDHQFH